MGLSSYRRRCISHSSEEMYLALEEVEPLDEKTTS
jgi:hypothetical protein